MLCTQATDKPAPAMVSTALQSAIDAYMQSYNDWSDACEGFELRESGDAQFRRTGRFQHCPSYILRDISHRRLQAALWRGETPDGCFAGMGLSNGLNDGLDRSRVIALHDEQRRQPAPFIAAEAKRRGVTVAALLDASQARVLAHMAYCSKEFQRRIDAIGLAEHQAAIDAGYENQIAAFVELAKCKAVSLQDVQAKQAALNVAIADHGIMDLFDGREIDTLIYALAGVERQEGLSFP